MTHLLLMLPVVLLAAAAAAYPPSAGSGPAGAWDSESPLLTYDVSGQEAFMQALAGGILAREGRCVYLVSGGRNMLLIFPHPVARWNAARGTILFGDRELSFGEEIGIGGGGGGGLPPGPLADEARRRGCDTSQVWWGSPELVDLDSLPAAAPAIPPPPSTRPAKPPPLPRGHSIGSVAADEDGPSVLMATDSEAIADFSSEGAHPDRQRLLESVWPQIDALGREFSDRLASRFFDSDGALVMRLLGDDPVPSRRLEGSGGALPVRFVPGARMTLHQTLRRLDPALPRLRTELPEMTGAHADERTGELVLTIVTSDPAAERLRARDAEFEALIGAPVRIEIVSPPRGE